MSAHDAPTPGSAPATRSLAATTLLFASSLTVMAGALVAPALPRIAHQFAADPEVQLKSRLLLTVPALAVVVAGVLAGLLTDRLGRLKVLLGGLVIYAVGGASGLFLEGLDALLVGRFVLGVGVAAVMTAATTLIADLWPGPARTRFLGVQASFMGVGGIVFLVGGGALADLHWRAPFAIYLAALLLVPAAWLAFRGLKPLASSAEASLPAGQASAPVGVIWSAGALGFLLFYFIPTQVPFSLEQRLGAGGLEVGLVMGIANGVSAVASLLARRIIGRLGPSRTMALTFALVAVGFALLIPAGGWGLVLLASAVIGGGTGLLMPNLTSWLVLGTPPARRGRLLGGLTMASFGGMFLSPLLAQPVRAAQAPELGLHGPMGVFALATALALLGAAAAWWTQRRA